MGKQRYTLTFHETAQLDVTYDVEADSLEEALENVRTGYYDNREVHNEEITFETFAGILEIEDIQDDEEEN